ncbi:MAG: phospholipase [Muribaculaceae bacterium]|nr:phospholipase [Muribaculaceae bacterium]
MKPALIILAITAITGLILYLSDRVKRKNLPSGEITDDVMISTDGCSDNCCAAHEVCPSESILRSELHCDVVYYDDYELDAFAGRSPEDYTESDVEQFRDVLYTMNREDMLGWERSLKRRGIIMPPAIHDELIALYNS